MTVQDHYSFDEPLVLPPMRPNTASRLSPDQKRAASPALDAVLEERAFREVKLGRTLESDLAAPPEAFPELAIEQVKKAMAAMLMRKQGWRARARRKLARAAALCMAGIDYLDNGGGE